MVSVELKCSIGKLTLRISVFLMHNSYASQKYYCVNEGILTGSVCYLFKEPTLGFMDLL